MKRIITLLALATLSALPSMAQAGEYGRYATTTEQFEAGFPRMIDGRYPASAPPKERIPVGAYIPPAENSFANVKHYRTGEASVDSGRRYRSSRDIKGNARYDRSRAAWRR